MIDTQELEAAFISCLYNDDESIEGHVAVEGITARYGLHPERLEATREQVKGWLAQLPETFHKNGGGGWSFLNACMTRNDEHWGEHRNMEQLFVLGMGLGLVQCCMPREFWGMLPGGMPYYVVNLEQ